MPKNFVNDFIDRSPRLTGAICIGLGLAILYIGQSRKDFGPAFIAFGLLRLGLGRRAEMLQYIVFLILFLLPSVLLVRTVFMALHAAYA